MLVRGLEESAAGANVVRVARTENATTAVANAEPDAGETCGEDADRIAIVLVEATLVPGCTGRVLVYSSATIETSPPRNRSWMERCTPANGPSGVGG